MERLGLVKLNNNTYETFYNKKMNAIDYFYKDKENNEVLCFTIYFSELRKVMNKINSIEKFKEKYEDIFKIILISEDILDKIGNFQTFPIDFWDDCVMTKFKDMEVMFIPYIGKR